jgi:hypothetical protein
MPKLKILKRRQNTNDSNSPNVQQTALSVVRLKCFKCIPDEASLGVALSVFVKMDQTNHQRVISM